MNKVASNVTEIDRPRAQEIAAPLKESRKQRVITAATVVEELEQELEELRARNARLVEHNTRLKTAFEGAKIDIQASHDRAKAADMKRNEADAARDLAVHERIRLETIFGTMKNLMTQADFEITHKAPV